MTDSATPALPTESRSRMNLEGPAEILQTLERYAEEHPEAKEYWIETEIDAAYLLLAMAASLKHLENDVTKDKDGIKTLRHYGHTYRQVVQKGNAIQYLHDLTEADALSIYGLRIRSKGVTLQ